MSNRNGGHFGFFDFIKIAHGLQLHTRLDIIMGMPDMSNQKRKKLYQTKQGLPSWLPDYSKNTQIEVNKSQHQLYINV